MKKLIIAFAAVGFFASCKKDYLCECVSTSSGSKVTVTVTTDLGKQKKAEAETSCTALNLTTANTTKVCTAKEN